MIAAYSVIGLLGFAVIWAVVAYNGLVEARVKKDKAWHEISARMKRRYNLIPILVETVKRHAGYEREIIENVVLARNMAATTNGSPAAQAAAENRLTESLRLLFAVAETYPEFKDNQVYMGIQAQLAEEAEHIHEAQARYNDAVRSLNDKIDTFPSSHVADMFGFEASESFDLDEGKQASAPAAPMAMMLKFGGSW
ncbi:LemA family protein [Kordiimonas marina]|uniref:LemA family protein n=1 Tax=Kordiimonas marina TaxID=2872312 RepID=UPI001FF1F418|nr:LemA family protein [Kordiimonas marina]MCJ9428649.1 LemA family protein [Kordiimonas marina]